MIVGFLLVLWMAPTGSAATAERFTEGELDVIVLENDFLIVKVAANSGGRICSLIEKADGVEQVWWRGGRGATRSGLIDDKAGFEAAAYTATLIDEAPERVAVKLVAPDLEPYTLSKTVTLLEGEPAVHIEYAYTNLTDKPIKTRHMVRNYYTAGGKAGPEDKYFWAGERGPATAEFPYGDVGVSHNVLRPWYAVVDTETHTGLAMVVDSEALDSFHNWADGGPPNPTMEWMLNIDLKPNGSLTVPVTFILLRGLEGVTDATAAGVFHLKPTTQDQTLTLEAQAYPVIPLPADRPLVAHFKYETLDRIFLWEEEGIHFESAAAGSVVGGDTSFSPSAPGTHIVTATVRSGDDTINHFEMPVVIGHSTGGYLRGQREAEQSQRLVVLTDRDVQHGYVAHWGQRRPPFEPAGPIELTMGGDEYESLELGLLALKDLGNVTLKISGPGWPDDAIELRTQQGAAIEGRKLEDGEYALSAGDRLAMSRGEHKAFWCILKSHTVKPGRYALALTLHPDHAPARAVPVVVDVLDVPLPLNDPAAARPSLYFYHTLTYTGSRHHLKILREHYLRQAEIYFGFRTWFNRVSVQRDEGGRLVVNFSGADGVLGQVREMGFDQLHIVGGIWSEEWFKALSEETAQQQDRTRHEFVSLFVDHLYDMGFTEVWNYVIDEPSVPRATAGEFVERIRKLKQAAPRLKLHMTMNHYAPELVNTLNPYMDRWTPTSTMVVTLLEDARRGTISFDADDQIGFYGGGWYHNIVDLPRTIGWLAACHGVDYYSLFAYSATRSQWRMYDRDGAGVAQPTPAMQGIRDGFEDFAYWRQFEALLGRAEQVDLASLSPQSRAAIEKARQFHDKVFADGDDSLIPMHLSPGGNGARPGLTVNDTSISRWQLLTIKGQLLRHTDALREIDGMRRQE